MIFIIMNDFPYVQFILVTCGHICANLFEIGHFQIWGLYFSHVSTCTNIYM